jgi:hypothetical protein
MSEKADLEKEHYMLVEEVQLVLEHYMRLRQVEVEAMVVVLDLIAEKEKHMKQVVQH